MKIALVEIQSPNLSILRPVLYQYATNEALRSDVCHEYSLAVLYAHFRPHLNVCVHRLKGDLRTICRCSYIKVYKLITLGTKFKTLLSLGRKITMFSKFITNYIEQG